MLLPSDQKAREVVEKAIQEAVISKTKIDDATQHISDIAERVEDKTGMKAGEFKKRVSIRYKEETKPEAFEKDRELAESLYEENDILKG